METLDSLFQTIGELVALHSPSGREQKVDDYLLAAFDKFGVEATRDDGGNVVVRIPGRGDGAVAITAHKDEIGAIVTSVQADGRLKLRKLGGSFPWIYGEGVVDILGDVEVIPGVLSFGSRHVAHGAPSLAFAETAPLRWADTWVETFLSEIELEEAGVHAGCRVVVARHRKRPFRIKDHIASYALDNKASLAILLELARTVRKPPFDLYLVATAKEEVGATGGLYFTQRNQLDAIIALEVAPVAADYDIRFSADPVLVAEDGIGLYDDGINMQLRNAARKLGISCQLAVLSGFGSDASIAIKQGHVARGACLGFPTLNTHGFEICHLEALRSCFNLLASVCGSTDNMFAIER